MKALSVLLATALTVTSVAVTPATSDAAKKPAFAKKTYKVAVKGSVTIKVKNAGKKKTVKWSTTKAGKKVVKLAKTKTKSNAKGVATLKVTGKKAGKSAKITAKIGKRSCKCTVKVTKAADAQASAATVVSTAPSAAATSAATAAPGTATTAPGTTTNAPGKTTNAPGKTTNAPGTTTKAPGTNTNAPSTTTKKPSTTKTPATPEPVVGPYVVDLSKELKGDVIKSETVPGACGKFEAKYNAQTKSLDCTLGDLTGLVFTLPAGGGTNYNKVELTYTSEGAGGQLRPFVYDGDFVTGKFGRTDPGAHEEEMIPESKTEKTITFIAKNNYSKKCIKAIKLFNWDGIQQPASNPDPLEMKFSIKSLKFYEANERKPEVVDLSKPEPNGAATYANNKLTITDAEQVFFKLKNPIKTGETVSIRIKGSSTAGANFRAWIGDGYNGGKNIETKAFADLPAGEFDKVFDITAEADKASTFTYITLKKFGYDNTTPNIKNVTIDSIEVRAKGGFDEAPATAAPVVTNAPSTETAAPSTETEAPSTETAAPSTETEAPSTETEAPVVTADPNALDLTKAVANDLTKITKPSTKDGQLVANGAEWFGVELNEALADGDKISIKVKGSCDADTSFRTWIGNKTGDGCADQDENTFHSISAGDFEKEYELKAGGGNAGTFTHIIFKKFNSWGAHAGHGHPSELTGITIDSIVVKKIVPPTVVKPESTVAYEIFDVDFSNKNSYTDESVSNLGPASLGDDEYDSETGIRTFEFSSNLSGFSIKMPGDSEYTKVEMTYSRTGGNKINAFVYDSRFNGYGYGEPGDHMEALPITEGDGMETITFEPKDGYVGNCIKGFKVYNFDGTFVGGEASTIKIKSIKFFKAPISAKKYELTDTTKDSVINIDNTTKYGNVGFAISEIDNYVAKYNTAYDAFAALGDADGEELVKFLENNGEISYVSTEAGKGTLTINNGETFIADVTVEKDDKGVAATFKSAAKELYILVSKDNPNEAFIVKNGTETYTATLKKDGDGCYSVVAVSNNGKYISVEKKDGTFTVVLSDDYAAKVSEVSYTK